MPEHVPKPELKNIKEVKLPDFVDFGEMSGLESREEIWNALQARVKERFSRTYNFRLLLGGNDIMVRFPNSSQELVEFPIDMLSPEEYQIHAMQRRQWCLQTGWHSNPSG